LDSLCDAEPAPTAGASVAGTSTSEQWREAALIVTVETFADPLVATLSVYAQPPYETCPPTIQADPSPLMGWSLNVPRGMILTVDGAIEQVRLYDKAAKVTVPGDDRVGSIQRWSDLPVWPVIPGPCTTVCVVVTADTPTGAPEITVEAVERHS
jgi:hypothetical protein